MGFPSKKRTLEISGKFSSSDDNRKINENFTKISVGQKFVFLNGKIVYMPACCNENLVALIVVATTTAVIISALTICTRTSQYIVVGALLLSESVTRIQVQIIFGRKRLDDNVQPICLLSNN